MKGPGVLLSKPMASTERCEVKNVRSSHHLSDYKNVSDNFTLSTEQRSYQRQFYHIYNARLNAMRSKVESSARSLLGKNILIKNLSELDALAKTDENADDVSKTSDTVKVVVIGTLFKNQPLKPNILKELSDDQGVVPQPAYTSYVSEADELVLEDSNCRIRLIFNEAAAAKGLSVASLATGVVCGIFGSEIRTGKGKGTTGGKFLVEEIIFPELPKQSKLEKMKEDRFIALAAGLELSGSSCDSLAALELAVAWMVGDAGEMDDQNFNSNIERLVLAGNSLSEKTRNKESMNRARYLTKDEDAASVGAVNSLDEVLASLCVSLDVDLMPGEFDPANQILPQQPLHQCLFPQASPYPTMQTVTNPYMFEIGGRLILGTSGQNIDDILRNSSIKGPIEAMEAVLKWSHLAPTCPDTLGCFPFQNGDPFIITQRPHIFFAANQEKFEQRLVKYEDGSQTLLISVPRFSSTSKICLLNLATLECQAMMFDPLYDQHPESPEPNK